MPLYALDETPAAKLPKEPFYIQWGGVLVPIAIGYLTYKKRTSLAYSIGLAAATAYAYRRFIEEGRYDLSGDAPYYLEAPTYGPQLAQTDEERAQDRQAELEAAAQKAQAAAKSAALSAQKAAASAIIKTNAAATGLPEPSDKILGIPKKYAIPLGIAALAGGIYLAKKG